MGGIWMPRIGFLTSLSELVGYKAGIAIGRDEMHEFLQDDAPELFSGADEGIVRIRSEEFDELLAKLLFSVGNIESASTMPSTIRMYHRVKNDPELFALYEAVAGELPSFLQKAIDDFEKTGNRTISPSPFFDWAKEHHGLAGAAPARGGDHVAVGAVERLPVAGEEPDVPAGGVDQDAHAVEAETRARFAMRNASAPRHACPAVG